MLQKILQVKNTGGIASLLDGRLLLCINQCLLLPLFLLLFSCNQLQLESLQLLLLLSLIIFGLFLHLLHLLKQSDRFSELPLDLVLLQLMLRRLLFKLP